MFGCSSWAVAALRRGGRTPFFMLAPWKPGFAFVERVVLDAALHDSAADGGKGQKAQKQNFFDEICPKSRYSRIRWDKLNIFDEE